MTGGKSKPFTMTIIIFVKEPNFNTFLSKQELKSLVVIFLIFLNEQVVVQAWWEHSPLLIKHHIELVVAFNLHFILIIILEVDIWSND